MLLKNTVFSLRRIQTTQKFHFGAPAQKIRHVIETKHNPEKLKELRGNEQFQLFMSDYEKEFFYVHKKDRKPLALYNLFSYLPTAVTNQIANLTQDPQTTTASDQLFLPKISQNGVPVYQSVGDFAVYLCMVNKVFLGLPFLALATAKMPFVAFSFIGLNYILYYRSIFGKATDRMVVKMEILPQTQELIFQKINKLGTFRTVRARLNDIEAVDIENEPHKFKHDLIFNRGMRSTIDMDLVFRIKSTGEILMFDREGVWHEEGLNHELMP